MKTKIATITTVIILLLSSCFALTGCNSDDTTAENDLAYVQNKGTLVVGITDFAPMDYKDNNGEWIGFDADLAGAYAEYIGVTVEFIEINWDSKEMELENMNIDCVWNGMTLTDGVMEAMETSNAYCNNAQVVIVNEDIADSIKNTEDCMNLSFVVEAGSAGEEAANENGFNVMAVETQADALMEVAAGTAQACVIDSLMAGAMIGEGTSYEDLTATIGLNEELYGVGFRKGSDLTASLNEFLNEAWADGTIMEIAKSYGTQESVIEQK